MNPETVEGNFSFNNNYLTDSFTIMRVDTRELLTEIEAWYTGLRLVSWSEKNNSIIPQFQKIGVPRMNDKGLQDVMSYLKSLINTQTVQGNTDDIFLSDFIATLREDFSSMLMENLEDYEISENDFNTIVNKTVSMCDMFFSRTKDNLERQSYAQTTKSFERVGENKGGFSLNPFRAKT